MNRRRPDQGPGPPRITTMPCQRAILTTLFEIRRLRTRDVAPDRTAAGHRFAAHHLSGRTAIIAWHPDAEQRTARL